MLNILFGDLFDYAKPNDIIVNGCNCRGRMGAGFAAQIRRRFPLAYLEYAMLHKREGLKLGEFILVNTKGYSIFNAFTQENYGLDRTVVYVDYDALRKTMKIANQCAIELNKRIYLPLVGGGLANGDPDIIMDILKKSFHNSEAYLVLDQKTK